MMETFAMDMKERGFDLSFEKTSGMTILQLHKNGETIPFYEVNNGWVTTIVIENKSHLLMTKEEIFIVIDYYYQKKTKTDSYSYSC